MRRVFALVLLLTLAGCAAASGREKVPCGPSGAQTLASSTVARVYVVAKEAYGCASGGSKSYALGSTGERTIDNWRVGPVVVSGYKAAYGRTRSGVDTISADVVVRRLSDGHVVHDDSATSRPLPAEFFQQVDKIVLKSDGAVAWIGEAGSILGKGPTDVEVEKHDSRGLSLLDSGKGIETKSLHLKGSTLSWKHSGVKYTATLH